MRKVGLSSFTNLAFRNSASTDTLRENKQKQAPDGNTDENVERGNWSSKSEYLLSMIGYAVGLGNIWRFPYLAYKNGGGAFLIPYSIMLFVIGIPFFFLECSIGQFSSQGPINVWRAVPAMQGVGIAMVLSNVIVTIYYNVLIAYSLFYLFSSFQFPLPWSECSSNCSITPKDICNGTAVNESLNLMLGTNSTCHSNSSTLKSASEKYWDEVVLQRSSGIDETGPVVWYLALCLLLSWILVGGAIYKGVKSSGKVVYVTATFPYVVLFILLIRGLTLEGAKDGIDFYIGSKSNFTKLGEAEVWKDAASQIFFSLSAANGGIITLASYNRFKNNVYTDSMVVCLINCATSVFAGFAIFSILGHMAFIYGKPVTEVAQAEFGLVFVVYPDALSKLPISPLWSILFFVMLLTLGLDSQFAGIEVLTTCLQDAFPQALKSKRSIISVVTCAVLFLLGLLCVTRGGIYWVTLMDQFCGGWVRLMIAVLEVLGVIYIYGGNRFIKDIEMMIGTKSLWFWFWWRSCWYFISPCVILVILAWSLFTFEVPTYAGVQYPWWGIALGWCITAFCLIWIPIIAIYKFIRALGGPLQRLKEMCSPTEAWGPYLETHGGERYKRDINSYSLPQL
ncbi:sodium- and chloride-dependent neutral and basic amino acid transporter B(0+) [Osmerus mordax]|uniref:sodium- and chloride-dependent neutral and basic amino acid transporter B(0+) n=1 Tax=Osmerus mordax TaxID=8014 RepID=UPI00350F70DF